MNRKPVPFISGIYVKPWMNKIPLNVEVKFKIDITWGVFEFIQGGEIEKIYPEKDYSHEATSNIPMGVRKIALPVTIYIKNSGALDLLRYCKDSKNTEQLLNDLGHAVKKDVESNMINQLKKADPKTNLHALYFKPELTLGVLSAKKGIATGKLFLLADPRSPYAE